MLKESGSQICILANLLFVVNEGALHVLVSLYAYIEITVDLSYHCWGRFVDWWLLGILAVHMTCAFSNLIA